MREEVHNTVNGKHELWDSEYAEVGAVVKCHGVNKILEKV